jgi:hypothetical protein
VKESCLPAMVPYAWRAAVRGEALRKTRRIPPRSNGLSGTPDRVAGNGAALPAAAHLITRCRFPSRQITALDAPSIGTIAPDT